MIGADVAKYGIAKAMKKNQAICFPHTGFKRDDKGQYVCLWRCKVKRPVFLRVTLRFNVSIKKN